MFSTQDLESVSNLCKDPDTKGFDLQAGKTWIYPTNYPFRTYQYSIIQEALHQNTLVSLPTGLGKTFIAAVVMYNFYRWYPTSKIVFMAPTKPLVKQQIDACYDIMGIPKEATAELTGTKLQASRRQIWVEKRVFFITPQVLQNDLEIIPELADQIKCLVVDEAHRAKGNHAYCVVVNKLIASNTTFRVLALSATPGNSAKDAQDVINNLLIAHLEFRNEDSPDVKPYVFERTVETVVVPLGDKLEEIKDAYSKVLDRYCRILYQHKVVTGSVANLTKGRMFLLKNEYAAKRTGNIPQYQEIMKTLSICITLFHGLELLMRDGMRSFLLFYKEHIKNPLIRHDFTIPAILQDIENYLGPEPNVQQLPDGSYAEIPANIKYGHPKFYKLRDILESFFTSEQHDSRVIVFFEYRDAAHEAHALLIQSRPRIRAKVFLGQRGGNTQKLQMQALKQFREGVCNTLLSTSIGEEGLDVGEVNLIICFNISNKSSIRMIQRMGRTGRRREGKVIVLVSQGREAETLQQCLTYKENLSNFMLNSRQLTEHLYKDNPKMIPSYVKPSCHKMYITVTQANHPRPKSPDLDDVEIVESTERLTTIDFTIHLEKQRIFQSCLVGASARTNCLVSLLQYSDSLRYNLGTFNPNLVQTDIRHMFARTQERNSAKSTQSDYYSNADLFAEITNFIAIEQSTEHQADVNWFEYPEKYVDLTNWIQPELSIFDTISEESLCVFKKSLVNLDQFEDEDSFDRYDFSHLDESVVDKTNQSYYEMPKNFEKFCKAPERSTVAETQESNLDELFNFFKMDKDDFQSPKDKHGDKVENGMNSDETIVYTPPTVFCTPPTQRERSRTPDLFDSTDKEQEEGSPILCSFSKLQSLRSKRKLYQSSNEPSKKPNLGNLLCEVKNPSVDTSLDATLDDLNVSALLEEAREEHQQKVETPEKAAPLLELDGDFFDFSSWFHQKNEKPRNSSPQNEAARSPSIEKSPEQPAESLVDSQDFAFDYAPIKVEKKKRSVLSVINEDTEETTDNEERMKKLKMHNNYDKELEDYFDFTPVPKPDLNKTKKAPSLNHSASVLNESLWDFCDSSILMNVPPKKTKLHITTKDTSPKYSAIQKPSTSDNKQRQCNGPILNRRKNVLQLQPTTSRNVEQKENSTPTRQTKRSLNASTRINNNNSDSDFEESSFVCAKPKPNARSKPKGNAPKPKPSKRPVLDFIDLEAVLDDSGGVSSDEDSGEDVYDPSFVTDNNESAFLPNTQMQVHYMKSVQSPVHGMFKIPEPKTSDLADIYSQVVSNEDNHYLHDSFCVDSDVDEQQLEISELELLERKLEKMRRDKRRGGDVKTRKRLRIIQDSDSSDE